MAIIWTDCGQNGWMHFRGFGCGQVFSSRDTVFFEALTLTRLLFQCSIDKEKKKWRS
jgi:hypothetical protein